MYRHYKVAPEPLSDQGRFSLVFNSRGDIAIEHATGSYKGKTALELIRKALEEAVEQCLEASEEYRVTLGRLAVEQYRQELSQ